MKLSIRTICFVGMFAAIISVLSILTIQTPWGVPFTLQTFAIALCGFVLGKKYGTIATAVYVLLGTVGVPVFAGMSSGLSVLVGPSGGYIYGFILMAFFCGVAYDFYLSKTLSGKLLAVLFALLGLACCHVLGIIQLKFYYQMTWVGAAIKGTVPYLVKDIFSVAVAFLLALAVRKALNAAGLLNWEKAAA
jgi:biotin transport system substrate-specific component